MYYHLALPYLVMHYHLLTFSLISPAPPFTLFSNGFCRHLMTHACDDIVACAHRLFPLIVRSGCIVPKHKCLINFDGCLRYKTK